MAADADLERICPRTDGGGGAVIWKLFLAGDGGAGCGGCGCGCDGGDGGLIENPSPAGERIGRASERASAIGRGVETHVEWGILLQFCCRWLQRELQSQRH